MELINLNMCDIIANIRYRVMQSSSALSVILKALA